MIEYHIASATTPMKLIRAVNKQTHLGWVPIGGVSFVDYNPIGAVYMQALIRRDDRKYEDEPEPTPEPTPDQSTP